MTDHSTRPRFGAVPDATGTRFTLWAPAATAASVRLEGSDTPVEHALDAGGDGVWSAHLAGVTAGARYRLRVEDTPYWPDPASRSQPDGVHGASEVVDAFRFAWSDAGWRGIRLEDVIVYELHVGAFTPAGTFAGVIERLPHLVDLGITAVELMPVAACPGRRNWGYDGAALFAPSPAYGTPDDLRRLVDAAHGAGLAVLLDVVYNHLGPDGAYLAAFTPEIFSPTESSPWGARLDFDGPAGPMLRAFFIDNAVHWVREYHLDGLRLDATHAIHEARPTFAADLASAVRAAAPERAPLVIAEDDRNLDAIVRPVADGGWGLDAVWADDFHHQVRRHLAGDADGYFADFSGRTRDVATTIRQGWFFTGQHAPYFGGPRGTDPAGLDRRRFVTCVQNHDQIGNRAMGERLHHQVDLDAFAAASVLLLLAPETPLLFMGQEWAASTPFLFFTDHDEPLGSKVTAGRREEFRRFAAFSDPEAAALIPDPQAPLTFECSRLRWYETEEPPHRNMLRLYRAALAARRQMAGEELRFASASAADDGSVLTAWEDAAGSPARLAVVRLSGRGPVVVPRGGLGGADWRVVLSTDLLLAGRQDHPLRRGAGGELVVAFDRPGAVVLAAGRLWSAR